MQVITGLTTLSTNAALVMLIIIFVLLIFGCFLEGIAVLLITIPIFQKIIVHFAIDPVQFGVVMTLASMIGLLTPPVGMCLYAVSSITKLSIVELSKEMWPYLLGIFLVLPGGGLCSRGIPLAAEPRHGEIGGPPLWI